jgi:glyoxylase-like metal-dependent hydrolase (beta-lactamase superfamily II)
MPLYLRQLLAGRDFATGDTVASQMANFVYLVGDTDTRKCMAVDPAWDVKGILDFIDREGMELAGALITHYHQDHVGGSMFGWNIAGLADLMALRPVRLHANANEVEGLIKVTGLSTGDFVPHTGGDEEQIGNINIKFLHTPGHTPGSQCFLAESALVSGDTLFINGCGRVDLPGSDPEQMYYSLTNVLAKLPDGTVVFPGHNYASKPSARLDDLKRENYYLRVPNLNAWLTLMGQT